MSNVFTQGDVVRVSCTFSFNVPLDNTFFSLQQTHADPTLVVIGTPTDDLNIVVSPTDPTTCYVDIDTFDRVGSYNYFFYTRGSMQAGAKGSFIVQ